MACGRSSPGRFITRGWGLTAILFAGSALLAAEPGHATCLSLKKGNIIFDVQGCGQVKPEEIFDLNNEKYSWIKDLDTAGRKKLYDSYRGMLMKGRVVKSEARDTGITGAENVLEGEVVRLYMLPSPNTCQNVAGKRLQGNLKERCCDGGGDIPCLLNTSYLFTGVRAIGAAGSGAGDDTRERAAQSAQYKQGVKFYKTRKWKKARKAFERAASDGSLDLRGQYLLGATYRELEKCRLAIPLLERIYQKQVKKQIWGDEIPWARKAVWLLARCYAKINDPGRSIVILNAYLLEPGKYKKELRESLRHKDFGWIHTSKDYRDYKKAAQQKLRGK